MSTRGISEPFIIASGDAVDYENNWEAKTLHQLEVRIKNCLKGVDQVTLLKTFGCVKKRLNDIRLFDIIENQK